MKAFRFLSLVAVAAALSLSCSDKENKPEDEGGNDNPAQTEQKVEITDLVFTQSSVTVPGPLSFSMNISGGGKNLSTLEVSVVLGDKEIAKKSIRTPGATYKVDDSIDIPFLANMKTGDVVGVRLEAINVDGKSFNITKTVQIQRPSLPDELYLEIGEQTFTMSRKESGKDVYATDNIGELIGYENNLNATIYSSEDKENSDFIWGGTEDANKAALISFGGEPLNISYPAVMIEVVTFDAVTFEAGAEGTVLDLAVNGVPLVPSDGKLAASVAFTQGQEVTISGIDDIESCYNRDFFTYDGGKLTFKAPSGTYDVIYSPRYGYFWLVDWTKVAPDCLWIFGHGFTCAPVWHEDYYFGGWLTDDITRMGYAVKTGDGTYQCSMYLNNEHEWSTFEFEVYSDLDWNKTGGLEVANITGDTKGIAISKSAGLTSAAGFESGYYTITFNTKTKTADLKRISDWVNPGETSGYSIAGVPLDKDVSGFCYADINFTNGAVVSASGFDDIEGAYNRDFFSYEGGQLRFTGKTGKWTVYYYPSCNYMWVFNNNLGYPDCLYILGNGKISAPRWDSEIGSPSDFFYNRNAPYYCVAPSVGSGKFQATMYLTDDNDWKDVGIEIYSDLSWGKADNIKATSASLGGPDAGMFYVLKPGEESCSIKNSESFVAGYFRFIITASSAGAQIEITRIAD